MFPYGPGGGIQRIPDRRPFVSIGEPDGCQLSGTTSGHTSSEDLREESNEWICYPVAVDDQTAVSYIKNLRGTVSPQLIQL